MPKIHIHTCRDIPDELVKSLRKDGIAMVDSEFTGLDVGKKGTDRLCLFQICGKDKFLGYNLHDGHIKCESKEESSKEEDSKEKEEIIPYEKNTIETFANF